VGITVHGILAYIDPGSGSLLIQALIASIVAVPFVLRHQIGRVIDRLRGSAATAQASTETDRAE
jgi:hypothetical protein